jgi:hypothetical protein
LPRDAAGTRPPWRGVPGTAACVAAKDMASRGLQMDLSWTWRQPVVDPAPRRFPEA